MARICIIGAGAAGLSAIAQLRPAGHDVECFEKTDRVGGHWHTDYEALHLITARDATHFEDFPMPADYPHFPRRDQVRRYIESYADHADLRRSIAFSTEVLSAEPVPAGDAPVGSAGWRVVTSRGDEGVFDALVVANGHLWSPRIPEVPGTFTGTALHSSEYDNVGDLEGNRVLVVGAGNSGCDIAVDVAQHRLEADVVVRKGIHFQPKMYFGVPRQQVPWLSEYTAAEQDLLARLLAKVAIGPNSAYPGLPEPESHDLAGGATTVNDLLLYWIQHGRVTVRPGIERFDGKTVHFSDGTSAEYDSIVYATGFDVALPFLDADLLAGEAGVPRRYAGGILPEGAEKLYFVGLIAPRGPQIPIYGVQSKLVLDMIALQEQAGPLGMALANYFSVMQEAELRIDIVRAIWEEQMRDTERLLRSLAATPAPVAAGSAGN
ncbi:MAG: NAD(P)-binding domain-containing protein [Gordonia sp. (in: high G+C Gram-positive bacteria)]|uniref:flavin-containing monooxygenase n=1 Tax=Gordonia sp. (in: high G+C Gram-positive bacteria) TaxID=84139 RepID=UPI0039E2E584